MVEIVSHNFDVAIGGMWAAAELERAAAGSAS
jgi:hypothetical protein